MISFESGLLEAMPIPFQLLRIVREISEIPVGSNACVGHRTLGGGELGSRPSI